LAIVALVDSSICNQSFHGVHLAYVQTLINTLRAGVRYIRTLISA